MGFRRRKPSLVVTLAGVTMAVTACSLVVDTSGLAGPDAVDASDVSAPDPTDDFVDLLRFETSGGPLAKHWLWFGVDSNGGAGEFREDRFYKDGACDCPVKWVALPSLVIGKWTHVKLETDFKRARAGGRRASDDLHRGDAHDARRRGVGAPDLADRGALRRARLHRRPVST